MAKSPLSLKISGMPELEKSLQQFSRSVGRGIMERSLKAAAKPMLEAAKRNVPIEDGDLERSLKMEVVREADVGKAAYAQHMHDTEGADKAGAVTAMRAAYRARGGPRATVIIGPDLNDGGNHAHLVEFGTGPRIHESGKLVGEMPADPFLRPAFDAEVGAAQERLKGLLAQEIAKSAARAAKRAAKKRGWEV